MFINHRLIFFTNDEAVPILWCCFQRVYVRARYASTYILFGVKRFWNDEFIPIIKDTIERRDTASNLPFYRSYIAARHSFICLVSGSVSNS